MTDAKDYKPAPACVNESLSYINYRIILKAKAEGVYKKTLNNYGTTEDNFKNSECYHKFIKKALNEISILDKYCIKPIKTTCLIKNYEGKPSAPALPQFLHIYSPHNNFDINITSIKSAGGLFLTSSRFKDAKIYKPNNDILKNFKDYYYSNDRAKTDFICVGINSEAEMEFIEKSDGSSPPVILPHYSLLNSNTANRLSLASNFDFKNILQLSALDPFCRTSKYGFTLRNSLAFHLSKEMAIFYLSEKSSLLSIIKKFKDAGKPVKIFGGECHAKDIRKNLTRTDDNAAKNRTECNPIQKFILKTLEKENITIDNLIKLSNIKFNVNSNEILKNISILEINSEIGRFPGGIIKKLKSTK
ncbi:MAG: hypothetical protein M1458_03375 [Deltaproteobacteria bacterium]|nr:hypothetical protein [Deltaproteobacteria bacterium]